MRTPRDYLDRSIQVPYPLDSNMYKTKITQYIIDKKKLNIKVKKFCLKRTAAAIALTKIKDVAEQDDSDND